MRGALVFVAGLSLAGVGTTGEAQESKGLSNSSERVVHVCAACHGEGGNSTVAAFPKLAGQQPLYTVEQLKLFRSQKRAELDTQAYMWGVTALLEDADIQGLADYYTAQKPSPGKQGNARLVEQGRRIYEQGVPSKSIRACATCHGENGEGAAVFPRLASQHSEYLVAQLKVFRTRLRPYAAVMIAEVKNMSDAEMQAVAAYLQGK